LSFLCFKFQIQTFKKVQKKYLVNVLLYHCVNFQNKIHCILGSAKMTKSSFQCIVHYSSSMTKSQFVILAEPKVPTYFVLKIYTLIETTLSMVFFFLNLFKMFEFKISKVQNSASMEAELQMTALLMKVRSKLIYNEVELSRGIIN
jgi:hypothetical protein